MKAQTQIALAAALAVSGLAGARALSAEPGLADYLGRWNIRILGQTDTFESAGLEIASKDGTLEGKLVWKWGGREPIGDIAVEAGELRFRRGGESYRARLEGETLRGAQTSGDKETRFEGRRAGELSDPSGTWKVYALEDPDRSEGRLVLEARGGAISGRAEDADGRPFEVRDAKLSGYVLELTAVSKENPDFRARARLEVRGDRLFGKLELSPGESDPHAVELRGERERRWGEPVALLAAEGTEGWRPRNPAAKFGWKVSDGVLRNSPPDIDVVSEKKFRDFKLHLEYRVRPGSNSGIYLRGRYELQILGDTRVQPHGNMAVYSVLSPAKNPMRPLEEWQSVDVTLVGRWLTVVLNGKVVHEDAYLPGITGGAIDPWEDEPGPILLQGDHGPIEFRNIAVTPAL